MAGRWVVAGLGLCVLVVGLAAMGRGGLDEAPFPTGSWARVRRVELAPSILVAGDVFSRKRTIVRMEVESMGAPQSVITWIVPNGWQAKKGEILCRIDASWFDDEERAQRIETARAESEMAAAERTLDGARAGLRAFRDGERVRQQSQNRSDLALARTTEARTVDRQAWVERMALMGYVATTDVAATQTEAIRAGIEVQRARTLQEVYDTYTVPRFVRWWEVQIENAAAEVAFSREQYAVEADRLAKLHKQFDRCTIRAPHDGEVIYADTYYDEDYRIRAGTEVWEGQDLIYLPERGTMAIQAVVPESQAMLVKAGQEASVRVGAFPDLLFPGKVEKIEGQPIRDWKKWAADVKIFYATIAVEDPDRLLFPDMSAAIEIRTGPSDVRLAVPSEAVAFEDEAAFCEVLGDSGWERRAVATAPASMEMLEVRSGLVEGDRVRLRPWNAVKEGSNGG